MTLSQERAPVDEKVLEWAHSVVEAGSWAGKGPIVNAARIANAFLAELAVRVAAEAALARLLRHYDEERQAIDCSPEHYCPDCTLGTVPNNLNRGLCQLHEAMAALPKEPRP